MTIRIEFPKFSKEYHNIKKFMKTEHNSVPCIEFDGREGHMVFNLNNILFYVIDEED